MASQAQKASVPQMKFVAPPSYANAEEERAHKLQRLALAFRVFAKLGFDEGVAGHLTLRDPIDTDCFWVNPFGVPFAHMTVSDLLKVDHQGNIVGGGRPDLQLYNRAAFAIHSRIHMARPDVHAACHSHSIHGKAFSTLGRNISIITQDTCALYKNCNLYPNFGGIVLDDEEGDNIARHLGDGKALILQNHGILTCGETIEEATGWFIGLERACQAELLARAAGEPILISDEEAEFTKKTTGTAQGVWFWAQPYFTVMDRESKGEYKE
ncbi:arad-like aldolase/epimerase [Atractiella rhizophila]|nr:arad-like aldolase/epimerase [Atractiella rhizophila]